MITAYPIRVSAMSGVHGTGLAGDNDAPAITAALTMAASAPNGVVLLDGKFYINEPITVPAGVTLMGLGRAGEIVSKYPQDPNGSNYISSLGSVIYCGPNGGILLKARTALRQVNLIRDFCQTFKPVGTDIQAFVSSNYAGTAVQLDFDGYDVTIEDVFAIGFNLGFKTYGQSANERINITRFYVDAINGFDISDIADVSHFRDLHCWGYWTNHQGFTNEGYRSGIAFNLHDRIDACMFSGLFSYGYKTGIQLSGVKTISTSTLDVWNCKFEGCVIDNDLEWQDTYPCVGIRTTGIVRQVVFTGCDANSCDVNWDLQHQAGHGRNALIGCSTGRARTTKVRLGSGDGLIDGFTSEGDAPSEFYAISGVGSWRIDNYSVVNNSAMIALVNAPGPNNYNSVANLDFGNVTAKNVPQQFHLSQYKSFVDVASAAPDAHIIGGDFKLVTMTATTRDSFQEFANNVFTPKNSGVYEISYGFGAAQDTGAPAQTAFYLGKNGQTEVPNSRTSLPVATTTIATGGRTIFVELSAGETIGLYAYLSNGGTLYQGRMTFQARRVI